MLNELYDISVERLMFLKKLIWQKLIQKDSGKEKKCICRDTTEFQYYLESLNICIFF